MPAFGVEVADRGLDDDCMHERGDEVEGAAELKARVSRPAGEPGEQPGLSRPGQSQARPREQVAETKRSQGEARRPEQCGEIAIALAAEEGRSGRDLNEGDDEERRSLRSHAVEEPPGRETCQG